MNPFSTAYKTDASDQSLVELALNGKREALNDLIARHQPYIYNIAWKMAGDPDLAADLSQEALIKIVSNLRQFNFKSSFRTWAYRIVRNHFLNDQKKSGKVIAFSFADLGAALDATPNVDLTAEEQAEQAELIKEVRLNCLSGMIMCLSKEQRMVFIIGELFRADHTIGSEIMEVSKANFRMKLSKARKDLVNFMQHKCGLIDKANPCRCHKKVTLTVESGIIDAKNLLQNREEYSSFRAQLEQDANYLTEEAALKYVELHQDHSFQTRFERKHFLQEVLEDENWKSILNMN